MLMPVDHQQKKYQYQKEEKKIGGWMHIRLLYQRI
jgi:hypothetical protein